MNRYRLEKVCVLIRNGHSITEAAFSSGFQGTSYFSETFRKQYGMSPSSYPTAQRLLGIQMAMQQAGLPLPPEYIRYGSWEYESGADQTRELMKLALRPTAILAMNDLMAAGSMAVLTSMNIRIPEDIAVAGFDNREIAAYLQPPLTTIALPTTEIGTRAAIHLMDMIRNPDIQPVRDILNCAIIHRKSV